MSKGPTGLKSQQYSTNMILSAQAQHTVWCSRPCLTYFDITTHNPLCLHVCVCVWGGPVLKLICLSLFCRHIIPLFWNICSLCLSLSITINSPIHSSHFCRSGPCFSSNTIPLMIRCKDKETILNTHMYSDTNRKPESEVRAPPSCLLEHIASTRLQRTFLLLWLNKHLLL